MPLDTGAPCAQALIFGAIGTLVETSDMQRRAFNAAFAEAGLGWSWAPPLYRELLLQSGGRQRIDRYAMIRGVRVDAPALHRRKAEIYDRMLRSEGLRLRPGVADTLRQAERAGLRLAMASSTARSNIDAIFAGLGTSSPEGRFELITDASMVARGKPAPDVYHLTLDRLGLDARACVAIEDTPESVAAARAAGVRVIGFPGAFASHDAFGSDTPLQDPLDFGGVWALLT